MASMSPSLMVEIGANVAKLRTDMDRSINEISRLRRESDNHAKAMRSTFEGSIAGISSAFVIFAAKATAAIYTVRQAWNFAKGGAEIEETKGILDNLARKYQTTSDSMVKSMREASQGLIADSNLASIALGGLAKGLKPEQMINLASAAALLGDTVGKNATEAFNDLSEALESGRVKAIRGFAGATIDLKDTFGDLTDRLTAAEKAQAMYALVMIHATKLQKDQTSAVSDTADEMERIEARWKNTTDTIKTYAMRATVAIYKFGLEMNKWGSYLLRDEEGYKRSDAKLDALKGSGQASKGVSGNNNSASEYQKQIAELKRLLQSRSEIAKSERNSASDTAKAVKDAEREKRDAIKESTDFVMAAWDEESKAGEIAWQSYNSTIEYQNSLLEEQAKILVELGNLQTSYQSQQGSNLQTAFGAGGEFGGYASDLYNTLNGNGEYEGVLKQMEDFAIQKSELIQKLSDEQYEQMYGNLSREDQLQQLWNDVSIARDKQTMATRLSISKSMFGGLSAVANAWYVASDSKSKAAFAAFKAFSIAESIATTYLMANLAFASQLIPGDPTSLARAKIAYSFALASGWLNTAAITATAIGGAASNRTSSGAGGSAGSPTSTSDIADNALTSTTTEAATRGQSINIYVEGNLVNHDAFAREILPALLRAQSDNVR